MRSRTVWGIDSFSESDGTVEVERETSKELSNNITNRTNKRHLPLATVELWDKMSRS